MADNPDPSTGTTTGTPDLELVREPEAPRSTWAKARAEAAVESPDLTSTRGEAEGARDDADGARRDAAEAGLALDAHDARIQARRRTIKDLKRQLKDDQDDLKKLEAARDELARQLKDARKGSAAADRRARKAESRYGETMLRELSAARRSARGA